MRPMVLKRKYKGNTLPEVLIAIAILSFASVMGMGIYVNIQENTQPFLKLKASELAATYMQQAEDKQDYLDQEYHEEAFRIRKQISHSDRYPDCIIIRISVFHQTEKKVCELQKLIHAR